MEDDTDPRKKKQIRRYPNATDSIYNAGPFMAISVALVAGIVVLIQGNLLGILLLAVAVGGYLWVINWKKD